MVLSKGFLSPKQLLEAFHLSQLREILLALRPGMQLSTYHAHPEASVQTPVMPQLGVEEEGCEEKEAKLGRGVSEFPQREEWLDPSQSGTVQNREM